MNKALAYEKVFAEVTTSVSIKLTGRWKNVPADAYMLIGREGSSLKWL